MQARARPRTAFYRGTRAGPDGVVLNDVGTVPPALVAHMNTRLIGKCLSAAATGHQPGTKPTAVSDLVAVGTADDGTAGGADRDAIAQQIGRRTGR